MTTGDDVANVPAEHLPELEPLVVWYRVQSTMRLVSTLCTRAYTKRPDYRLGGHSVGAACYDAGRITKTEHAELVDLRRSHRECVLWDASELSLDAEALLVALNVMAAYCSRDPALVGFSQDEILDAMDVLTMRALERVSGDAPDAYDPPGGI